MKEVILQFYNANEKMPNVDGDYVVITQGRNIKTLSYSNKYGEFNTDKSLSPEKAKEYAFKVDFWAELPNLKEEDEEDIVVVDIKKIKPLFDFLIGGK